MMTNKVRGVRLDKGNVDPDGEFLWLDVNDGKGRACSACVVLNGENELSFEVYDEPRGGADQDSRVYDDADARWVEVCTDPFGGFKRGGESPYALKTQSGNRFAVPAGDLVVGAGKNPVVAGLIALGEGLPVLLEARKLRVRGDDIWECYPVIPVPEGFTALGLDAEWIAMLLTDGEVQTKIEEFLGNRPLPGFPPRRRNGRQEAQEKADEE